MLWGYLLKKKKMKSKKRKKLCLPVIIFKWFGMQREEKYLKKSSNRFFRAIKIKKFIKIKK